jgi:prophage antirepressor-like protein
VSLNLTLTFDGHRVRMVGTPERPEWVAKDVCRVLRLHNTSQALTDAGVAPEEKGISQADTPGGPQAVSTVTEPGLWKLVMASRKPSAQRFKHWLATDVLPCIRQHGCYPPPTEASSRELPGLRELIRAELRAVLREELGTVMRDELQVIRMAAAPAEPLLLPAARIAPGEVVRSTASLTIGLPSEDELRTVAQVLRRHRILTPATPRHEIGRRVSVAYQLEAARHRGDDGATTWPPKPLRIDRAGNYYPPQAWAWLEDAVVRIAGSMGYLPRPLARQAGLFPEATA